MEPTGALAGCMEDTSMITADTNRDRCHAYGQTARRRGASLVDAIEFATFAMGRRLTDEEQQSTRAGWELAR